MSKNIVICCDGAGQEFGAVNANVVASYSVVRVDDQQAVVPGARVHQSVVTRLQTAGAGYAPQNLPAGGIGALETTPPACTRLE